MTRIPRAIATALVIGACAVLLLWLVYGMWQQSRTNAARARLSTNQAQAGASTAADALETMGNTTTAAEQTGKTVQEGKDAIDHAEAGNSNDAADRAACELRIYRDSERCRRLREVHSGAVASPGPAR